MNRRERENQKGKAGRRGIKKPDPNNNSSIAEAGCKVRPFTFAVTGAIRRPVYASLIKIPNYLSILGS